MKNVILGANAYYDAHFSAANNRLDQFGLGLELLSKNIDARVNWYDADPARQVVDERLDNLMDRIVSAYESAFPPKTGN